MIGFFYIVNYGLSQEEVDRQWAIGKALYSLPEEELLKYRAPLEEGIYSGYRPRGMIELKPGLRDSIEMYNVFKFVPQYDRDHPAVIRDHLAEVERFHRHIHENIVYKLLRLIAIVLELPSEDALIEGHSYEGNSDCHLRYMMSRARRDVNFNAAVDNIYTRGHSDFGSLTLLFRQPVAGLQVLTREGQWKYVKPLDGSITVNIADALQFWSNGYLKSSVHRVIVPPPDQAHIDRLGLLYFVRPGEKQSLKTVDSPLLKRLGLLDGVTDEDVKAGDWVRARVRRNWQKPPEKNENLTVGGVQTRVVYD